MNSFIININNQNFNNNNKNILKEIGYNVLSDNAQIKNQILKKIDQIYIILTIMT